MNDVGCSAEACVTRAALGLGDDPDTGREVEELTQLCVYCLRLKLAAVAGALRSVAGDADALHALDVVAAAIRDQKQIATN